MSVELMMSSRHLILYHPLLPSNFPSIGVFSNESALCISWGQNTGASASASASVLPMNIQGWFPLGFTGWSPCCSRHSQESSPTPQFKSINSLVLSLLYGPTRISLRPHLSEVFILDLFLHLLLSNHGHIFPSLPYGLWLLASPFLTCWSIFQFSEAPNVHEVRRHFAVLLCPCYWIKPAFLSITSCFYIIADKRFSFTGSRFFRYTVYMKVKWFETICRR